MNPAAIELKNCTKTFRGKIAVHDLSLTVEPGTVYGLVGDNGAGKTTTIKMLLGLLPPSRGSVSVLGCDPQKDHVEIMKRTGYVSENRELYDWMTVSEILWFNAQFYSTWDNDLVQRTMRSMELNPKQKIKHLSRGMRAKVAMLLAMGHKPDLLILDEPSSGLDPLVRREILEHIIAIIQSEGRTVFLSSHLIDEVERIADRVGILCDGDMMRDESLDAIKETSKRIRVAWNGDMPDPGQFKNVRRIDQSGREEAYFTQCFNDNVLDQFRERHPASLEVEALGLEEIVVETIRAQKHFLKSLEKVG
ncbi:MAG: ABC transporter ATP-binding protein [Candidatus Omnitrophica bacterium]|nr:ABC transporter ATP-binding protein [Candidatus Omnitrophota bacterium]